MLVFIGSGIFIALEYEQGIQFHQALYFMFITISTIGYGDYKPETMLGQMFILVFMTGVFVLIPKQVAKLRYVFLMFKSVDLSVLIQPSLY